MTKILICSTTHLSNNPRLVKELNTLSKISTYKVEVVFFQFDDEKTKYDVDIIANLSNIIFSPIDWSRENPVRLFYTIISKLLIIIHRHLRFSLCPQQQIFPGYLKLYKSLKKAKADIYHGHNLGVLAAITTIAKNQGKKCMFDAEDFHRGETAITDLENRITIFLENKYIPQLDILISASPLITQEYTKLYPALRHININNVFQVNKNEKKLDFESSRLKCIWFSQVVGLDRGLQDIISGISKVTYGKIKLDIIGDYDEYTKQHLLLLNQNPLHDIQFFRPLSPSNLDKILINYDVGIASETSPNYNRTICLTNKIFQYVSSGLAILASDTLAQKKFMDENCNIGATYHIGSICEITEILNLWIRDRDLLKEIKKTSQRLSAEQLNWALEKTKFLNAIEYALR